MAAGLATTWVGAFEEAQVRAALDISPSLRPIALIALGTAAETPQETPRRPLKDIMLGDGLTP